MSGGKSEAMEICEANVGVIVDKEDSESTKPPEIWGCFKNVLPNFFDDNVTLKKKVVEEFFHNIIYNDAIHLVFVPSLTAGCENQYYKQLKLFTDNAVWFVGQLLRIMTRDRLFFSYNLCLSAQKTLLDIFANKSIEIFRIVIQEYIKCVNGLLNAIETFNIDKNMKEYKVYCFMFEFVFVQTDKCYILLEQILSLLEFQCYILTECSPDLVCIIWSILIKVLADVNSVTLFASIKLSAALVNHNVLPDIVGMTVFCEEIGLLVQFVMNTFHSSRDQTESGNVLSKLLNAFNDLFSALAKLSRETLKSMSHILLKMLSPLLQKNSPFITSDASSTCQLFGILLNVQSTDDHSFDVKWLYHLTSNVQLCQNTIPILEVFCQREINKYFEEYNNYENKERVTDFVDAKEVSNTFCRIYNVLMDNITRLNDLDKEHYINLLKLMNTLAKTASNISAVCDKNIIHGTNKMPGLSFLGKEFYEGFIKVIERFSHVFIVADFEAVKYLFEIVSVMLTLPEIILIPDTLIKQLIAFQSLPWWKYSFLCQLSLTGTNFQDVIESFIYHQDSVFQVESIKKLCVRTLGQMLSDTGIEWRMQLFSRYYSDCETEGAEVLLYVPFILYASPSTLHSLIESLLQPALLSQNPHVQLVIPDVVSLVLCVLSGSAQIVRTSDCKGFIIKCKECDLSEEEKMSTISYNEIRTLLNGFMAMFSAASPQVLCRVISVLPRLANHLPFIHTPECVKRWIIFVNNPNVLVRDTFSKVVVDLVFRKKWVSQKKLLSEEDLPLSQIDRQELVHSEPLLDAFNKQVMSAVRLSLKNCDSSLQLTVMSTIRNMGQAPLDCVIYPCVKMLLIFILHPHSVKPSIAQAHLQAIADAHNKIILNLFEKYRGEFCKLIVDLLLLYSPANRTELKEFITTLSSSLSYFSCSAFLNHNVSDYLLKYLLVSLINKPQLNWILDCLAELTGVTVKVLVTEGFKYVYPYLFMEADESIMSDCCKYIESVSECDNIQSLIRISFKRIMVEILLYYSKDEVKVKQALMYLMQIAEEKKQSTENCEKEFINFLALRFLGVLNFMEGILVSRKNSDTVKKNILLTLPGVIKLMGSKHITPVRLKVLAMLRAALTVCHGFFPDLTCAAWEAFILNVDVAALRSLLSTIFVSLLPLLENFPDEVGRIFRYLVIENDADLNDHFKELFFIPNISSIQDVYERIQSKIQMHIENVPFIVQLQCTLKIAKHENVEVRLHGLKKLRSQIMMNWNSISELILNNDTLHPVIIDFLDALITGTQDEEEMIRISSSECLGELGALDPGRLPDSLLIKTICNEGHLDLMSNDFAYSSLMKLVKGFQEARCTISMDEIAYAIQELLKFYKVSPKNKEIWNRFPPSVQEQLLPFLNTRYVHNTGTVNNLNSPPHPVFGSFCGQTMMSWAYNWASVLIPLASQPNAKQVFTPCQFSFKKDTNIMMFFLPYILLHALLCCSEKDKKLIEEEMAAVICYSNNSQDQNESIEKEETIYKIRKDCITNDILNDDKEDGTTQMMCVKIVYSLLDFLYQWLRKTKKNFSSSKQHSLPSNKKDYKIISDFLEGFSSLHIVNGSYNCQEYSRSLLYLEEYVVKNPNELENLLPLFGKIYFQLNEPDGLKGIIASHQSDPKPDEMLLYHELTGQLHDAATCYERLAAKEAQKSAQYNENLVKSMVNCYLSMDQPITALHIVESLLSRRSQSVDLRGEQAEALLSLGRMDQLESVLKNHSDLNPNNSWGINIGKALVHLKQCDESSILDKVNLIRKKLADNLKSSSAMSASGYKQGYEYIVRLHVVHEFEKIGQLILNMLTTFKNHSEETEQSMECLGNQFVSMITVELDQRLKLLQPSSRVLQPVLCMRSALLSAAENMLAPMQNVYPDIFTSIRQEIGKCWLKRIAVARKSNNFQQAYSNILTAEQLKPKGLFIEKAKLHWAKLENDAALTTLKRGIEQTFPSIASGADKFPLSKLSKSDAKLLAKARLLIATYNDQKVNVEPITNLNNYSEAVEACSNWEKSIICLAQYQYKMFTSFSDDQMVSQLGLDYQEKLVRYFGKSLQYGCKYIYQSMPRMLSIWLDYGTRLARNTSQASSSTVSLNQTKNISEQKKTMEKINNHIESYSNRLPVFMFMTSYSQLLSRICHQQNECYQLLKNILAAIINTYPEQSLWPFIAISKSKHTLRVERCKEILNCAILKSNKKLSNYIDSMQKVHNFLIELGIKKHDETKMSINVLKSKLPRLLKQSSFCKILLPLQKYMTVCLPRTNDYTDHNPYPDTMVYIHEFKEEVTIYPSLQKPKRFYVIGSDGLEYPMMVKANDDLRLDARLMDFFSIINMYLQRDADSRDRRLNIRTYSVTPLNDNSGLIEWVPNLSTYRSILVNLYKQMGIDATPREFKNIYYGLTVPLQQKKFTFVNTLLKKYPSVLRKWYLQEFPHPTAWYQARTAFVRSTAVMSIVGYIVGLGDRHSDNILFDNNSGEIVHVDFSCCCNLGEGFQWPERVPFRLTHNMVDAMGPTGFEGMFIQSCEITNRVMRRQIEQLISVLKPLIYDNVIKKDDKLRRENSLERASCETTNALHIKRLNDVQLRLQGSLRIIPKNENPPNAKQSQSSLSVEGQTRSLIQQATDIDNLCQMYVGWSPFL